jgi:cell division protein FtsX
MVYRRQAAWRRSRKGEVAMDYHELEKMTVIQLREEAKKFPDLKGVTAMKKDELIHVLVEHLGIAVPEKKKAAVRAPLGKAAIKKRIAALRTAKSAAHLEHDRKKTGVLRRRIHAAKRRLRTMA